MVNGIAVAKAIRTEQNSETLTRQSFTFCPLPSAFCSNSISNFSDLIKAPQKYGLETYGHQTMPKVFQLLLIGLDIVLALAAAYTLFPALMNAAATLPVVLAALFAAGIILAIYGD